MKIEKFEQKLSIKLSVYRKLLEKVAHQLNKLRSLQHFVDYLRIVKDIQDIGYVSSISKMSKQRSMLFYLILQIFRKTLLLNFKNKDDHKTFSTYLILTKNITERLENIYASNLKAYADKMNQFWYSKLNAKFSK